MREIKFRAWNKTTKEWCNADMAYGYNIKSQTKISVVPDILLIGGKEFKIEVMQFTGLKDKNGKEIYEGDILKTQYSVGVVEFGEHQAVAGDPYEWGISWGFYLRYSNTTTPCQSLFDSYISEKPHDLEILGNIYENPELMEEKE